MLFCQGSPGRLTCLHSNGSPRLLVLLIKQKSTIINNNNSKNFSSIEHFLVNVKKLFFPHRNSREKHKRVSSSLSFPSESCNTFYLPMHGTVTAGAAGRAHSGNEGSKRHEGSGLLYISESPHAAWTWRGGAALPLSFSRPNANQLMCRRKDGTTPTVYLCHFHKSRRIAHYVPVGDHGSFGVA